MDLNIEEMEHLFQQALNDFEDGNYKSALLQLIALHQNNYRQQDIKAILDEACYKPNEQEMKAIYSKNVSLLTNYPYILSWKPLDYDDIPISLYMIDDNEFYLFDRKSMLFTSLYQAVTEPSFNRYLKNFEQQRCFFNETNFSKIAYLCRNIRKSENLGVENHLYLNYDSIDDIIPLLLVNDLAPVLIDKKLVISIGFDYRMYPEKFSEVFGITYDESDAQELLLDEIERMIFGWKIANVTGTSFLADILDFHPNLLTIPDCFLTDFYPYYISYLKGKTASQVIAYLRSIPDDREEKSIFYSITHAPTSNLPKEVLNELNSVSPNQLLEKLQDILPKDSVPTPREWISGIYLAFSKCHNRDLNTRVIPAVFMYPHDDMFYLAGIARDRVEFYLDIVCSYPDHKAISIIRDPVTQAGSVIRFMLETHPLAKDGMGRRQMDPFYCMAFGALLPKDYLFPNEHPLRDHISVVRFEDLKLNPEATLESLTDYLDLPACETIYQTTWCGYRHDGVATDGNILQGFDQKPLYNQHSQYLSIFDKYRIEMLLCALMKQYGYEPLYYEQEEFSNEQKYMLFQYPFRCESIETTMMDEMKKQSRQGGMDFIKFAIVLYKLLESNALKISDLPYTFSFLPWLRPKKELLEKPIYKRREYPTKSDSDCNKQ